MASLLAGVFWASLVAVLFLCVGWPLDLRFAAVVMLGALNLVQYLVWRSAALKGRER